MHLNSVEASRPRQVVVCMIRFSSGGKGNRKDLSKKPGIACWLFDGRKQTIAEGPADVRIRGKTISSPAFTFEGSYPDYSLTLCTAGKQIGRLCFHEPARGKKEKFFSNTIGPVGFYHYNLYLDFDGTLNSKRITGRSFIQKVVITSPMPAWWWGNLNFKDGSRLDYFLPRLDVLGHTYTLLSCLKFARPDGTVLRLGEFCIKKSGKEWELKTKDNRLSLKMRKYASSQFVFESIGRLEYDEHLVEVTSIHLQDGKKTLCLYSLGHGSGIIEDANGFLI